MQIIIPQNIIDAIKKQAKEELPNEACGYLGGKGKEVLRYYPMTNIDHSPEHFRFDPKEQFEAVKKARQEKLQLIAMYHSHPETPARMSEEDKRLAVDIDIIYIIFSISDNILKAFKIDDKKNVQEIEIICEK